MRLQLDSALAGTGVNGASETGQAGSVGGARASGRVSNASASGDTIQISGPSSALNRLAVDRAARIQQLTAVVQGGNYKVSGADVSHAIVEHATTVAR